MENIFLPTINPLKALPSIFELSFLQNLETLSEKSVKHILNLLPSRFSSDYIVWIIRLMVEWLSLHYTDALISENVYGLRRSTLTDDGIQQPLSQLHKIISLLFEVVLPSSLNLPFIHTIIRKYQHLKHLRFFKVMWSFISVYYRLLYTYQKQPYINPFYEYIKVIILKKNHFHEGGILDWREEKELNSSSNTSNSHPNNKTTSSSTTPSSSSSSSLYSKYMTPDNIRSICMLTFVIGIKVLEWYATYQRQQLENALNTDTTINDDINAFFITDRGSNNNNSYLDNSSQSQDTQQSLHHILNTTKITIPPPPKPLHTNIIQIENTLGIQLIPCPENKTLCPLCGRIRTDPCVSSGNYVYCYKCLSSHIRDYPLPSHIHPTNNNTTTSSSNTGNNNDEDKYSYCPVSGVPCRSSDIIRIYDE